jgi:preprotein translocase subunit SecA
VQVLNAEHVRGDKTLENKIIAGAGRSGMITVATNMAGRGVDIKPDLINYKKLALKVEELAGQGGQPLVVDVANPAQAQQLAAWLQGAYPYRIGGDPPAPGETLIRVADDQPVPPGCQSLKSGDFPTGGLYVIGTERAKSRRIDDQLIGRAGRQGDPGRSRFFLSLEDDLLQHFGGRTLQPALELLGAEKGRLESRTVEGLVARAQAHVGAQHSQGRESNAEYDKVMNRQRDTFYGLRDAILNPEADLRHQLLEDTVEVILEALPDNRRLSPDQIRPVLAQQSAHLGLSLQLEEGTSKVRREELEARVRAQVESQLGILFSSFDASAAPLDRPLRDTLLGIYDEAWTSHLEEMDLLRLGSQWSSVAGEQPETVFALNGFDAFKAMLAGIKQDTARTIVPQLVAASKLLRARHAAGTGAQP